MDIVTLGLRIVNDAAVRAMDVTSRKLDEMGAKGEASAAKVTSASERIGAAHAALATQTRALGQAYDRLSSTDLKNASDWFDRTYGSAKKVAQVQEEVAASAGKMTFAADGSAAGLGRIRYAMSSLASEAVGVNPILGRVFGTLGVAAEGSVWTIGVLGGIAAIGEAWKYMSGNMSEEAKRTADDIKRLGDEIEHAKDAFGSLSITEAKKALADAENHPPPGVDVFAGQVHAAGSGGAPSIFGGGKPSVFAQQVASVQIESQAKDVKDAGDKFTQATNDAGTAIANGYATLIRAHALRGAQLADAIKRLKDDRAELASLSGKTGADLIASKKKTADEVLARRVALAGDISTLNDALYPKQPKGPTPEYLKASFADDLRRLVPTTVGRPLPSAFDLADLAAKNAFGGANKGAAAELGAQPNDYRDAINRAAVLKDQFDAENLSRQARGQSALAPGKDLRDAQQNAAQYASAAIDAVRKTNVAWADQKALIESILKLEKEAGISAKDVGPSRIDQVISGVRSGADLANLLGGKRGGQYANILNTAANATENVTSAIAQGGTDPIADVQAGLSVLSLGKQIFGLGKQSHDAARAIQEANDQLRVSISLYHDSVTHDTLQAALDSDKQAYQSLIKSINDAEPGLKKEAQRNKDLAAAASDYNQILAQTKEQYVLNAGLDVQSLKARQDRAKGLSYQADLEDLAIKQQQEYNNAILAGKDAAFLASLAQTQLMEKTQLANQAITQLANSPTGFFAARYFGSYSTPYGGSASGIPQPPTTSGAAGGTNFNAPINININGVNKDPATIAKETVAELRKLGPQYGGVTSTIAATMEVMSTI